MADCTERKEDKKRPRPPIIMKFDAPEESSENSANDEVEGQSGEENSETSPLPSAKSANKIHSPVLTASKFGNSFGISEFNKPATFGVLKPTILKPSQLTTSDQPASNDNGTEAEKCDDKDKKINNNKNDEKKSGESSTSAPKFLPLGASPSGEYENSLNNSVATSSSPSFVFGQNLKQRVTVAKDDESALHSNDEDETTPVEEANENGASELLFSSAATVCRSTSRPGLTLSQAAQEIEEANRANKRKYSQVTPLTGEEGETNVLQINCKLFAFDKETSGWKERGRGTIRLNDRDEESRLVGRATGTQRLILNTKVWPGMTAELAGPKSLRLTAMDVHGDIRIFIVQAAPKEVDQLHDLLMQRLKRAKERQPKKLATDQ